MLDADVESTRAAPLLLRCRRSYRASPAAALRCGSMAPRLRSAVVRFDALPEEALRAIMLALPVDARAQAACVCRGWRAFLADVSLWQVLDLSPSGGVAARRVTENLARGAVARAGGQRACPPLWLSRPGCEFRRRALSARHAGFALTRYRCVRSAQVQLQSQA